jgi:hypothetical protein
MSDLILPSTGPNTRCIKQPFDRITSCFLYLVDMGDGVGGAGERNQYSSSLQAGRSVVEPLGEGNRFSDLRTCTNRSWGPPNPLYSGYQGCPLGVMRLGVGVYHPIPYSAEIRRKQNCNSTSPLFYLQVRRRPYPTAEHVRSLSLEIE